MSFNTLDFFLLFSATFVLYFLLPHKLRNPLLLIVSYVFYAAYSLPLTLFLVIMTLITYFIALDIERFRGAEKNAFAKRWMIIGVVLCLGVLGFYKYFNFISATLGGLFGSSKPKQLSLVAPLGISFVSFTLVSYIVDVYKGKIAAEKNLLKYALFVSFFPKVVQGPIEKAGDILPQFDGEHSFDLMRFREGMLMVLYGLFMKMVVADTASIVVDTIYGNLDKYSGAAILLATILFTLQIYCDFAGYSYTAIGAARVLGFDFRRNFRQPYLSLSVAEFWRRWHMSLNRWLIDYLYIPLGGSRCSKARKNYNTMVTFGLSGLWHGADWGYIVWGLLNGLYIIIESACRDFFAKLRSSLKKDEEQQSEGSSSAIGAALNRFFHVFITFVLVMFSWIFFRARKLPVAFKAIKYIFSTFNFGPFLKYVREQMAKGAGARLYGLDVKFTIPFFLAFILIVVVIDLIANKHDIVKTMASGRRVWRWTVSFFLIFAIIIFGVYGYGYSAGAFIYAGF
ncbi:MAG: MBOAT family protein [Ruminococcus sp.]|nr:MBOAT family protein [Ruminococcus sp.]